MKEEDFYKVENGETLQNNIELLLEDGELRKKLSFGNTHLFFYIKKVNKVITVSMFRIEKTRSTHQINKYVNQTMYLFN